MAGPTNPSNQSITPATQPPAINGVPLPHGIIPYLASDVRFALDKIADLDRLDNVASKIEGHTICALGDAAAMPVRSFVKQFRAEFEYYIQHGHSVLEPARTVAAA